MSTAEDEIRTITIAGVTLEVVPQPPMYLTRRLKRLQESLGTDLGEASDVGVTDLLFGRIGHQALAALIPAMVAADDSGRVALPLHAWLGYASEQAMEADDLDESKPPHPPTFPEIKAAFTAIKEVNDFDLFERLFGLLDPQMRRELLGDLMTDAILSLTPSSQSPVDGSAVSTSSTATSPTPTPNGSGSLSPASTG